MNNTSIIKEIGEMTTELELASYVEGGGFSWKVNFIPESFMDLVALGMVCGTIIILLLLVLIYKNKK